MNFRKFLGLMMSDDVIRTGANGEVFVGCMRQGCGQKAAFVVGLKCYPPGATSRQDPGVPVFTNLKVCRYHKRLDQLRPRDVLTPQLERQIQVLHEVEGLPQPDMKLTTVHYSPSKFGAKLDDMI